MHPEPPVDDKSVNAPWAVLVKKCVKLCSHITAFDSLVRALGPFPRFGALHMLHNHDHNPSSPSDLPQHGTRA